MELSLSPLGAVYFGSTFGSSGRIERIFEKFGLSFLVRRVSWKCAERVGTVAVAPKITRDVIRRRKSAEKC